MLTLFVHRIATVIAIPILALVGCLFLCLRLLLGRLMRLVGWELVWPPVELADLQAEADDQRQGREWTGQQQQSPEEISPCSNWDERRASGIPRLAG